MDKMMQFLTTLIVFSIYNSSFAVKLECESMIVTTTTRSSLKPEPHFFYMCTVKDLVSVDTDEIVDSVVVSANMTYYTTLRIFNSPLFFFIPNGITNQFKKLEILQIENSQLVNISSDDLKQFTILRELKIENTNLASLEGNLFKYNSKLETLSLSHNKIKSIDTGIFKPLKKLINFDFTFNECFNRKATGSKNVDKLIERIEEECKIEIHEINNEHDNRTIRFNCMSQTNHFTLLGHYKQCGIIEVISTSTKTIVDNVTSADNLDIYKSIYISESPFLYFLPSGIEKYLKHLEVIILENTQLMKITGDDLKPFCDLRGLFITSSNLTTLEEDLFAKNEKIEILALTNSKIKSVSSGVFKPLTKLFDFDFRSNACFNKKETHTQAVLKMIESIEEECKGVSGNKHSKKDKDSSKDNEVNKEKDSTKDKEKDSSNDNDSSKDKDKKSNKNKDSDKESKTTIEESVKETTTEATE